jgi:hypothetical protein
MVHALGYSLDELDPGNPGRLCRGRERWIEPWEPELEDGGAFARVHRLMISGAAFTDDSARDAQRGLNFSGYDLASVIAAIFPRKSFLAFMEDGHGADIPEGAEGIEAYTGFRFGGLSEEPLVRWHRSVSGVRELRQILGDKPERVANADDRVRGFAVLQGDEDVETLAEELFLLVGMSTLDSPPARFQPAALPTVLKKVKAVILLHRDKHGPAVGIYSLEPLKVDGKLETLVDKEMGLLVPFAIPPMLARWDRALAELRVAWMAKFEAEFPVPPALEPSEWDGRRRHRRRSTASEAAAVAATDVVEE